ncbi:hypothetical protein PIB30_107422, partial [Stylosanthes scabra]|nr:hypothetical protein [Stylosanthes scabra]
PGNCSPAGKHDQWGSPYASKQSHPPTPPLQQKPPKPSDSAFFAKESSRIFPYTFLPLHGERLGSGSC